MTNYALLPAKWGPSSAYGTSGGTVTWNYSGSFSAAFQSEITAAFTRWSQIADISFVQAQDGGSANITLGWANIDGSGKILGQANYTYGSGLFQHVDITFDTGEQWTSTSSGLVTAGSAYLETLALHEIGHALGLDHYNATTAVMNAYIAPNLHDLTQSDIDGIRAIYGAAAQPAPVVSSNQGGGVSSTQFDPQDKFDWSSITTVVDSGNRTTLVNYAYDDGSHTVYQYDVLKHDTWATLQTFINAAQETAQQIYSNHDGTETIYQYDVADQNAWSAQRISYDTAHRTTQITYTNDDGSYTAYEYDVSGEYNWSSVDSYFDTNWSRTKVVYNNDDGSHTSFDFNADQTVATTHNFNSNWTLIA